MICNTRKRLPVANRAETKSFKTSAHQAVWKRSMRPAAGGRLFLFPVVHLEPFFTVYPIGAFAVDHQTLRLQQRMQPQIAIMGVALCQLPELRPQWLIIALLCLVTYGGAMDVQ